jgi:hypothetical protein
MPPANKSIESFKELFLVFILLFFSGSPMLDLAGKFSFLYAIIISIALIKGKFENGKHFYLFLLKILIVLAIIFLLQFIEFDFISMLGVLNFVVKILLGAIIINHLGYKFPLLFFKVVSFLSIVAVFGFLLFNVLKVPLPGIDYGAHNSIIVYAVTAEHPTRNEGMFWEPGAFAGIITLCLALNFQNLADLWKTSRISIIMIIMALISTQSTTGYIVGFVIFAVGFLIRADRVIAIIFLPLIFAGAVFVYTTTTFLDEKINQQYEVAMAASRTEKIKFSNTRFGSLIFNLHYIKKEPFIGNGLHEKTRYADHPVLIHLIESGENLGDGNGFANIVACMGIPFVLGYFTLIFLAMKKMTDMISAVGLVLVVFFNLQGEQWLFTPIYMALPFLFIGLGKTYNIVKIN